MKRLSYLFSLLAAALAAASCEAFEENPVCGSDALTILEVCAGETPQPADSSLTRTGISSSLGGTRHVFWSAGDCLSLDGTASDPLQEEYSGESSAKFVWNAEPTTGNLLYPASFWKDAHSVTLPYGQEKMPGDDNVSSGSLPMCGVANGGKANLKHLCAILRIQWTKKSSSVDSLQMCYLEFKGRNDEQVSGDFEIDYENATLSGASSAPESRCVRAYSMKAVGSDTSVCNIVVPAGVYQKGFYVRLVDKKGYYMDAYTGKSKTLAPGSIVTMPCFKYNPSASKLNALAPASAGELIAIAKECNSGRYEGGAANICLACDIEFSEEQSLQWNSLGGIGTDENPYNGIFDGKGYSIKGLQGSTPLLGHVGTNGCVRNIIVDSTCVFSGSCATLVAVLDGKINDCTNYASASVNSNLLCPVILGGLVGEAGEGAVIENCTNLSDITVSTDEITPEVNVSPSYVGGIVGRCYDNVSIVSCTNSGKIFCNYPVGTKINGRPSYIGGISGMMDGDGSVINTCTNTGAIYNTNWNNSADLSGPVSGGITGVAKGTGTSAVTISDCKVLGPELMQTQRGIQGGIVGYMSYATASDCYYSKNNTSVSSNIPSFSGGICGKAYSSEISDCTVEDVRLNCKATVSTSVGGVCGWIDGSSKLLGNSSLQIKIVRNGADNLIFGGVAGSVGSGSSEISGNSFSGKYSTDGAGTYTAFSESNVCGSESFTVTSPNTLIESALDLSGVVRCGSSPLEGIVVTDGYQSVKTDLNGRFHLTSLPSKVRFVSVCPPEEYGTPVKNGLPQFYVRTDGEARDDISFSLEKIDSPDRFTVFVTADPQERSSSALSDYFAYHSGTCCNNVYQSIGKRADKITDRKLYGIVLGDIVHEALDLFSNHKSALSSYCPAMATYHIIGNHDYDPDAKEIISGMAEYEKNFGPANYSMNIGKFHFVMLNDIQIKLNDEGKLKAYDTGLTDDQITWLESDLQFVPTTTPLVICAHTPLFAKHTSNKTNVTCMENYALNCEAYKELFSKYSKVYVLAGHVHHNFTYIYAKERPSETSLKGVECLQLARCAGALWLNEYFNTDGTPRGYLQMDMDGTSVSWKYICDVIQKGKYQGKYGSLFSYSAPDYNYRDWNYSSGVPILKSTSGAVDENYQMKLYPAVDGCLWANIFLWDALWGTPVMTYVDSGGSMLSVEMPKVPLSDGPRDFTYDHYYDYYDENNKYWKEYAGTDPIYCPHMFKCTMPTDCPSKTATVSVTDRFGNTYNSTVNW